MPFGKELGVVSGTRQEEIRVFLWCHFRIGFNDNRLSAEVQFLGSVQGSGDLVSRLRTDGTSQHSFYPAGFQTRVVGDVQHGDRFRQRRIGVKVLQTS